MKALVEAHHGKVWAESDGKDKGSKFVVEIPVIKDIAGSLRSQILPNNS